MAEILWWLGRKRTLTWSWEDRNCCAWRADLNRPMTRSRLCVGFCETSAPLLKPLWLRCSRPGSRSRFAAPYERSLSVIITLGTPYCFNSLRMKRIAAFVFRRLCTRISSQFRCWSTARQSQCFLPRIEITTSSKCHLSPTLGRSRRMDLAYWRPNFITQNRIVSWLTMIPRSDNKTSTSRKRAESLRRCSADWQRQG